jgi:putative photosynthetic complex assembly protein
MGAWVKSARMSHLNSSLTPAPRRALFWLTSGLLLLSLAAAALGRFSGLNEDSVPAPQTQRLVLHFSDDAAGCVLVRDDSQALLERLCGEQGFVRGVLRALVRERVRRGLAGEAPFVLIARQDGSLSLLDESTGEHIALQSFGPSNLGHFSKWLAPAASLQPQQ